MREQDRAELLRLLNGSEKAVRRIDGAVARYRSDLPTEIEREQTPTQIAEDAKRLRQAIHTIASLIASGGDAWLAFKENCASDGATGVQAVHHLVEALGPGPGEPGDLLTAAAAVTADELKPTRKRPKSAAKAVRFALVFHTAQAATDAGVLVSRSSAAFQQIMAAVFRSANIVADPDHDIREYLKATAE